jgi:cardiolipin synthase
MTSYNLTLSIWVPIAVSILHLIGIGAALHALYYSRSSQGSIAWILSLMLFPILTLPIYFIFGKTRFAGYRERVSAMLATHRELYAKYRELLVAYRTGAIAEYAPDPLESIAGNDLLSGNKLELLINGKHTFEKIFEEIDRATHFVLIEFFIIKDDELGRALQERLIRKAKAGVAVYLLFDEVGSKKLSSEYTRALEAAGVKVSRFHTRQGIRNFFQINFRNHRKIVVVDGLVGFVGGHNVGDEYVGRSTKFSSWRDTHVRIEGPAVLPLQATFAADWMWATGSIPDVKISTPRRVGESDVLIVSTGPADTTDRCTLFFLEAITRAKQRVWIASPYFVPDDSVVKALQLAATRGVDVRVLLPEKADHLLVWLASFSYVPEVTQVGVKVYRYTEGFLHQKVLLVDDTLSSVGTANLDNRSLRLNFEIAAVTMDSMFCEQVATMLEADFEISRDVSAATFGEMPILKQLGSKAARLFSPTL